jgi:hypothetical protein
VTDKSLQLPWEDLRRVEGDLPWTALETFANAISADPDIAGALFAEYDRAWQAVDEPTYIDLYVPAIFALAVPKLKDEQRREIGGFLVDRLIEAGLEEAELTEEALLAAAGSLGPIILPKVLDALESMPEDNNDDEADAWSRCWSLTALAAKTDDTAIRDRTIRACIRLLEQIEQDKYDEFLGISAAWTLALLKCSEGAPFIQRLSKQIDPLYGGADYREALKFLQGQRTQAYEEAWERPVTKWLEPLWQMGREWYAQRDATGSEEEREAAFQKRVHELVDSFMASRLAADLPDDLAEDAAYITRTLLEYAHVHEGATPEELTQSTLRALLLELFPRKISAEREFFERVPPVVGAFLQWLAPEGILPEGESLAEAVRGWADDIVAAAMTPENWGPAKRFTMEAMRAGVDMTDQEAVHRHMFEEAQRALDEIPHELPDQTPITPPIPIVEHSPKISRNDPCPCGSGKKYKKCCGNPAKDQTTSV